MKHHLNKKQRTLTMIALFSAAMGLAGCNVEWKDDNYKAFVDGDKITECKQLKKIQFQEGSISFENGLYKDNKGVPITPEEYIVKAFENKICPAGFVCSENETVCNEIRCAEGQILCNETCTDPNTDDNHCGAKGTCSSEDANDINYAGKKCQNGCVNGECCQSDEHKSENTCEKDTEQNCGEHGRSCASIITGWKAGNCTNKQCIVTECTDGKPVNNACVMTTCPSDADGNTQHVFEGECESDTVANCGNHGNDCSNTTGWKTGKCELNTESNNVFCKAESCIAGYHVKDDKCVADSFSNCGAEGESCETGQVCTIVDDQAACDKNCGSGQVFCNYTDDDGNYVSVCIDPTSNPTFCNADENCAGFETCSEGQTCVNRKCTTTNCNTSESSNLSLCVVGSENRCVDLFSNEITQCGSCNYDCTKQTVSHASSQECRGGKCIFTCESGYSNCGTETVPNCIANDAMMNDSKHCGKCSTVCGADEFCRNGECVKSTCTNECLSLDNQCKNTNDRCGVQCIDCNTADNASKGECSNGSCIIKECDLGYHLTNNNKCEKNTNIKCGAPDSKTTINCTSNNHASTGICNNDGTCTATSCASGYHLETGKCVADSKDKCGNGLTNCTLLEGWNDGTCNEGVCEATKCNNGFCLNNKKCVDGSYNSLLCGTQGGTTTCTSCATGSTQEACVNGSCITSKCDSKVCFFEGTKCENSAEHCGASCTNCNTANHAASGQCKTGSCVISTCAKGYHKEGTGDSVSCVADSNDICGASKTNCNSNAHATAGICVDGTCKSTACADGYHVKDGECKSDDANACGPSAQNCSDLEGWAGGACTNKKCVANSCTAGFCLKEGVCINGTYNSKACGKTGGSSICEECDSKHACVDGTCKESSCDSTQCFYQGSTCANADTHCGPSCTDCTTANHASSGTCNTGSGSCTITGCITGYQLSSSNCVESTSFDCCGTSCHDCRATEHAKLGTCQSATCNVTECEMGYHLDTDSNKKNVCSPNTNTSCGTPNSVNIRNCTLHATASTCGADGHCFISACETGYHVFSDTVSGHMICEENDLLNCGIHDKSCANDIQHWVSGTCTDGNCLVSECDAGYQPSSNFSSCEQITCDSDNPCPESAPLCKEGFCEACPNGATFNSTNNECECPIGSTFSSESNACICPNSSHINTETKACECNSSFTNCSTSDTVRCLKKGTGWPATGDGIWSETTCSENCTAADCESGKTCKRSSNGTYSCQ